MPLPNIMDIFSVASPSVAQIGTFLKLLGKTPPGIRSVLLDQLDEQKVKQIATWSQAFSEHVNTLELPLDALAARRVLEPNVTDDFMALMTGTKYEGILITEADMQRANQLMTTNIKAENWKQAIMVGMSIAGLIP